MNWKKVLTGTLVMASLATTALPASATPYRTSSNSYGRNKVGDVVDVNVNLGGRKKRRVNKNKFKEVCVNKRVRTRRGVRTVRECKLVRVGRR